MRTWFVVQKLLVMSSPTSKTEIILVKISEIFLKGNNRDAYIKRLAKNMNRLLAPIDGASLHTERLRFYITLPAGRMQETLSAAKKCFGVHSLHPAAVANPNLVDIGTQAKRLAEAWPPGSTFKVETKRRDKDFPHRSPKVSREIGHTVLTNESLSVDVKKPDFTLWIDINHDMTLVYWQKIMGLGGLPSGTSGNVCTLLSGGIDSPVAAYRAIGRGCRVSCVYFHSHPYTSHKTKEKVIKLAEKLALYQGKLSLHVVPFTEVQKKLSTHRRQDLLVLMYRRMMMRTATLLAAKEDCEAIVTGESIGQVASQTLENLGVIENATPLPVLRPLVTMNKSEIIEIAKTIQTYELSIEPYEDSCSLFVPKHPATRAREKYLNDAEKGFPIDDFAQTLFESSERLVIDPAV